MTDERAERADTAYTILYLPNEILGICHNFLGPGHFVFIAPVCKRFKTVYLTHVSDEKITTGESCTSSISRARPYFAHKGKLSKRLALFWWFNTRYGRLGVVEWAHRRGYSRIWQKQVKNTDCTFGPIICSRAAKYGLLDVLRWLRQRDCQWDRKTCRATARGGHISVLQWARSNGCVS